MSFVSEFTFNQSRKLTDKEKKDAQAKLEKAQEEDAKISKIRFINHMSKGGKLEFTFRKYKEDPYRTYSLQDGMIYDLPMAVINHINEDCALPKREYDKGPNGVTLLSTSVISKEKKYECVPANFM